MLPDRVSNTCISYGYVNFETFNIQVLSSYTVSNICASQRTVLLALGIFSLRIFICTNSYMI